MAEAGRLGGSSPCLWRMMSGGCQGVRDTGGLTWGDGRGRTELSGQCDAMAAIWCLEPNGSSTNFDRGDSPAYQMATF